jgi:pimeloyl-ACP methyl ester carboxylesterase
MQNNKNTGIIFISGAGLNASVWDKVRSRIGTPSIAIDFPNRGDKVANKNLSFDDYIEEAQRQIGRAPFKEYILVCHSIGGVVGLQLATILRDKVKGFVAVSASIPPSGQSYISSFPFPQSTIMGLIIRLLGTQPSKGVLKSSFCSGLSTEDTENVVTNFTPEARSLYFSKIEHNENKVPNMYIKTLQDKTFPLSFQEQMVRNLGTKNVKTIESGHLPMLNKSEELAEMLRQFTTPIIIS